MTQIAQGSTGVVTLQLQGMTYVQDEFAFNTPVPQYYVSTSAPDPVLPWTLDASLPPGWHFIADNEDAGVSIEVSITVPLNAPIGTGYHLVVIPHDTWIYSADFDVVEPRVQIPASARPLDPLLNPPALHVGQVSASSYRGPRLSNLFITLIESFLADILSLQRRVLTTLPFQKKPSIIVLGSDGPGIYNTGDQDTRLDPNTDGLTNLIPQTQLLNMIRIQYIRQQLAFKLSTLK